MMKQKESRSSSRRRRAVEGTERRRKDDEERSEYTSQLNEWFVRITCIVWSNIEQIRAALQSLFIIITTVLNGSRMK